MTMWTDPTEIERLKELWFAGHSASQIGAILNKSRDQVRGRITHMHLPPREKDACRYKEGAKSSLTSTERMARWRANNREYAMKSHREYARRWRATPEGKRMKRNTALKKAYGITIDQFDAMVDAQGGKCLICQKTLTLWSKFTHVDHDHDTGEIRAILCHPCNSALGLLGEKVSLLQRAIIYLTDRSSLFSS